MMKLTREDIEKIGTGKIHLTEEDKEFARKVGESIKKILSEDEEQPPKTENEKQS